METYERIKILRKTLKLSQAAFGEKLGVTRDVINNIENNRLAKPEQKSSLIKLMCREFSVNENWLLYGTESMFIKHDTFSLDVFAKENGATPLDIEVVKAYFELDQTVRTQILHHFIKRLSSVDEKKELFPGYRSSSDLEEEYTPEENDKTNSSAS